MPSFWSYIMTTFHEHSNVNSFYVGLLISIFPQFYWRPWKLLRMPLRQYKKCWFLGPFCEPQTPGRITLRPFGPCFRRDRAISLWRFPWKGESPFLNAIRFGRSGKCFLSIPLCQKLTYTNFQTLLYDPWYELWRVKKVWAEAHYNSYYYYSLLSYLYTTAVCQRHAFRCGLQWTIQIEQAAPLVLTSMLHPCYLVLSAGLLSTVQSFRWSLAGVWCCTHQTGGWTSAYTVAIVPGHNYLQLTPIEFKDRGLNPGPLETVDSKVNCYNH